MRRFRSLPSLLSSALILGFTLYGLAMIRQQSFVAIDGRRYFAFADDALITLRYGWNLAHGQGLVWNPGERVEGITNLTWALWSALPALVVDKRLLPAAMQVSALVLLLVTAFAFRQIFRRLAGGSPGAGGAAWEVLALCLPLSYFPLVYWSLRGMETGLQGALMALAVGRFFAARLEPSRSGAALLGLACLTRPDGLIPSVLVLSLRLAQARTAAKLRRAHCLESLIFAGFGLAACLFRYLYYGSFLPNTYQLKLRGMTAAERILGNGWPYVRPFLDDVWLLGVLVLLSLALRPTWEKWTLASLPASMLAYTIYVGGDAFPHFRFLAPYVPFAFLVLLADLPRLAAMLSTHLAQARAARLRRLAVLAVALAVFLALAKPSPWTLHVVALQRPQPDDVANVNTAVFLDRILGPDASVGVFYAGSIPFYTGRRAVDFLGRVDPYVAALPQDTTGAVSWARLRSVPGHNKYDLEHSILRRRPTYVAGFDWGSQNVTRQGLELYEPVTVAFDTWSSFGPHSVLLLKGSRDVDWRAARSLGSQTAPRPAEVPGGRASGPS